MAARAASFRWMCSHPTTAPVLVGVGAVRHRPEDGPVPSLVELMIEAVAPGRRRRRVGSRCSVASGGSVCPKGAWTHPDPGREVAAAFGSRRRAHRPGRGGGAPAGGHRRRVPRRRSAAPGVAVVVGAEVAHGSTDGAAGSVVTARSAVSEPDEHLVSHDLGVSPLEVNNALYDPPTVYAVMESAWAHAPAGGTRPSTAAGSVQLWAGLRRGRRDEPGGVAHRRARRRRHRRPVARQPDGRVARTRSSAARTCG